MLYGWRETWAGGVTRGLHACLLCLEQVERGGNQNYISKVASLQRSVYKETTTLSLVERMDGGGREVDLGRMVGSSS